MTERLRRILLEVGFEAAIKWFLELLVGGLIFGTIIKRITSIPQLQIPAGFGWPLTVLGFLLGMLFVVVIFEKLSQFQPRFRRIKCDYIIKKRIVNYEYLDRSQGKTTHIITIKTLRKGVESYYGRYFQRGKAELTVISPNYALVPLEQFAGWHFFEVKLPTPLAKGNEQEMKFLVEWESTRQLKDPFVTLTVFTPTQKLELNILFPEGEPVREVSCEIRAHVGIRSPVELPIKKQVNNRGISWQIDKPKSLLSGYK